MFLVEEVEFVHENKVIWVRTCRVVLDYFLVQFVYRTNLGLIVALCIILKLLL